MSQDHSTDPATEKVLATIGDSELAARPEQVGGFAALFAGLAVFLLRHRRRKQADVVQFPLRARIEARDAGGHPIAA